MPSWTQLATFASLAASVAAHGRGATHRINMNTHQTTADRSKAVSLATTSTATVAPVRDVIIEMFQWSWDSVAQECTNFIGPAGYGYVQGAFAFVAGTRHVLRCDGASQ